MSPRPFSLHVPDAKIADLKDRLARTRLPDQTPGEAWAFGTDRAWLAGLIDHWRTGFDWRAQEAALNALPNFKARLHGIDLHYIATEGDGSCRFSRQSRTHDAPPL